MIKWGSFVKEKAGEWEGLNNAAIYSFNSNIINSLVREMFQNSIDARDKNLKKDKITGKIPPLIVQINYKSLRQEQFPDFDGFYKIFKEIAQSKPNKLHAKFFNNAFSALGDKKKIPFFIYHDFNTTGLEGEDDDPTKSFNACVVSEGISVKADSTAGGSFGIGKNATYGLSKLRTVFYVSLNSKGEYIFQGKAKLASHYDINGRTKESKVYCGEEGNLGSVRDLMNMPEPFLKIFHRDRQGLSQYALCPVENDNWISDFTKAILRNYWMLFEKGELEVELLEEDALKYSLNRENLEQLLLEFFNPKTYEPENILPDGNPYEFYKCYLEGKCISKEDFPHLNRVRFYFKELDNKNTNSVAYLRNDMVVYTKSVHGFGSIGYCGVFLCDDKRGNEILRAMEPPTHDSFDPDPLHGRIEGVTVQDGKNILDNIKKYIKMALQEIMDKYTKPAEDIKWLDDLLASLTGLEGSGSGERMNEQSDKETTERMGKDVTKTISFNSANRNTIVNDESGDVEGRGGGQGSGTGGGPGVGDGGGGNGIGGGPSGSHPSQKSKVKSRIFKTTESKNLNGKKYYAYKIILDSNKPISKTDLLLTQHGDSGDVAFFEIGEAKLESGEKIEFKSEQNSESEKTAYRLMSLNIPNVIQVFVHEPYKSSFKIVKS